MTDNDAEKLVKPTPETLADDGIMRFKRSQVYALLLPVAFVAGLGAGFVFWGRDSGGAAARPSAAEQAQTAPQRYDISVDDDPSLGPADAPITIIEFADFNCSFCRRFHQETFVALMQRFPDQIRYVYRDLPVVGGGQVGFGAAQAANCAGDQNAYWEYHDALYSGAYALDMSGFESYASDLGLDAAALVACVESGVHAEEVTLDRSYALERGINSTPFFFINGIPVIGAQPLANFVSVIESELAN